MTNFFQASWSCQMVRSSFLVNPVSSNMIDFNVVDGLPTLRLESGDHINSWDAGSLRRATWPARASLRFRTIFKIFGRFLYKFLFEIQLFGGTLHTTLNIFVYFPSRNFDRDFDRAQGSDPYSKIDSTVCLNTLILVFFSILAFHTFVNAFSAPQPWPRRAFRSFSVLVNPLRYLKSSTF